MPTLIVENLPGDIYERLQRRAKAGNRTLADEAVRLLEKGLNAPESKENVSAAAPKVAETPRLPDPPILDTSEISAPFDLPRSEPGIPVPARFGGERLPEPFLPAEDGEANDV
jgi:plasmid stability protein